MVIHSLLVRTNYLLLSCDFYARQHNKPKQDKCKSKFRRCVYLNESWSYSTDADIALDRFNKLSQKGNKEYVIMMKSNMGSSL